MALAKQPPVLTARALNRATLDRQLLLRRSPRARMSVLGAIEHLVGLQAQNVKPPYIALAARLADFDPQELSALMASREVGRLVTMRSTIHTHSAADSLTLRQLVQSGGPARELRMFQGGLQGVDLDQLTVLARELVEGEPRTMKQLREALLARWPHADPQSLSIAARCLLPLVQITPRGLWGSSGQVRLTTAEHWFGRTADPAATADELVLRYLGAFGPASVKDMQTWSGLTRMREVFARLRPRLLVFCDEKGVELFDLPDASRPDPSTPAPPRFLPEYDNLLLSHADRSRVVAQDEHKSLTWRGNQSYPTLLVDGFLAGIWQLTQTEGRAGSETSEASKASKASKASEAEANRATLTVQLFAPLGKAQRAEVAEEAERTLSALSSAATYDIRFGRFLD
ncbi:winged helix DNA-binding domain-containing protein [Streptomyces sp. NPDC005953]|uniref:winged helix DNA-binding domain-containing protein n=1 Tax=Streptomyces sp. NPDC005953 TaxID=3156719 RepID=UPI0033E7A2FF